MFHKHGSDIVLSVLGGGNNSVYKYICIYVIYLSWGNFLDRGLPGNPARERRSDPVTVIQVERCLKRRELISSCLENVRKYQEIFILL